LQQFVTLKMFFPFRVNFSFLHTKQFSFIFSKYFERLDLLDVFLLCFSHSEVILFSFILRIKLFFFTKFVVFFEAYVLIFIVSINYFFP